MKQKKQLLLILILLFCSAIGYCDERIARILLLEYVIISEMYEKRSMTVSTDNMNTKVQYTIRSIINQLQLGDDENE